MSGLRDRVIIVGGGGSGIGQATVAMLHAQGARPVILDRRVSDADVALPHAIVDLTDPVSTAAAVDTVSKTHGAPWAIVNCAGATDPKSFLDGSPTSWSASLAVNLMSCVHLAHAGLPAMIENGGGRLVFVSSAAAQMGLTDDALYAAGKAAVEGLTRSLALEFARANVVVNCVAPGPVATPLFAAQPAASQQAIARHVPMKRVGEPDELARVIVFLASPDTAYLNGQIIAVNGALHVGH